MGRTAALRGATHGRRTSPPWAKRATRGQTHLSPRAQTWGEVAAGELVAWLLRGEDVGTGRMPAALQCPTDRIRACSRQMPTTESSRWQGFSVREQARATREMPLLPRKEGVAGSGHWISVFDRALRDHAGEQDVLHLGCGTSPSTATRRPGCSPTAEARRRTTYEQGRRVVLLPAQRLPGQRDAQRGEGRGVTRQLQREAVATARPSGAREVQPTLPAAPQSLPDTATR